MRNQHEKFCHQPLNLVIRAKKTAVQNREASLVYERRFSNQVINHALTIVLCQLSFQNISKLNREQQRTCVNQQSVIRAKKTAVQNREASLVYERRFSNQVSNHALTIVLCQLSFRNISKLNREQQRTCVNHFDCETCTFCVEFVQNMFVPIYLKSSSSVTLSG